MWHKPRGREEEKEENIFFLSRHMSHEEEEEEEILKNLDITPNMGQKKSLSDDSSDAEIIGW